MANVICATLLLKENTNTEQEGHMAGAAILLLNSLPFILDTDLRLLLSIQIAFHLLQTRCNAQTKRLKKKV